jgi:hypothetical protein
MDMTLYALDRPWVPQEANWEEADEGIRWDEPGAQAPTDRVPIPVDMAHSGDCAQDARWYTYNVTDQVALWMSHPDENQGLLLEGQQDIARRIDFASADHYDPDLRPKLLVRYGWPMPASPSPTPTPTREPTVTPNPTPLEMRLWLPLVWLSP